MTQRGRHRRRRRGRALRAFLAGTALALTAAATMISASQATVGDSPGALKALSAADRGQLRLREQSVAPASLERLASAMGRPVGVGAVLADADRSLREAIGCSAGERKSLPVEPAATRAYCWDAADTRGWQPGAVTTSGDADDDGLWGQNRVILSGWSRRESATTGQDLARIAFVDAGDLNHPTYTWALLAVPVDGGRDYRALSSRLSGMVWYENKLLVTTTSGDRDALYVYDMNRIQRTTVAADAVGRVHGGWSAHGYRYVLPAVGSYRLAGGAGAPRLDGISLDRSTAPDSLAANQWVPAGGDRRALLWRYPFSRDERHSGLLAADPAGGVRASEAYETKATEIGGVLSYRSDWYVGGATGTPDAHGTLWQQSTSGARATRCGSDETHRRCWSPRAQSLSYWEETGELWSQSGRVLFALPLASVDRSLGQMIP
ncbi:hypothetical protein ABZT03_09240 [Streptomyces sp. NPDC005574]|uniref:hypothetical protein n=1 Tax=Streptomyces sp. NPDC005574 TaxID=3156891 RepID=UPI0033A3BFBD